MKKFKDLFLGGGFLAVDENADRREFLRFDTKHLPQVYLDLRNGRTLPIEDMSYGGFSTRTQKELLDQLCDHDGVFQADIVCFHLRHSFSFSVANTRGATIGIQVVHEDINGLLWLRGILEFFRIGLAMTAYEGPDIKQDSKVTRFKGHSASNLRVIRDDNGFIERLDISFKDQDIPSKVEFIEGELIYKRFDDLDDDSFLALEQGFFILAGITQTGTVKSLDSVMEAFWTEIDTVYKPPAASKTKSAS